MDVVTLIMLALVVIPGIVIVMDDGSLKSNPH